MQDELDLYMTSTEESMQSAIERLQRELSKVRTGKATTGMVKDLLVDYYGSPTPMSQVANLATTDSKTITIQPWEKSMLAQIEQSIFKANLGITPMNDGEMIRLVIPPLTEERRKDLVKQIKALSEDAKVSMRNARREMMEQIKIAVKGGFPEDAGKRFESSANELTTKYSALAEKYLGAKEQDLMTI